MIAVSFNFGDNSEAAVWFEDFQGLRVVTAREKRAVIADLKRQIRKALRDGDYENLYCLTVTLQEASRTITPEDLKVIVGAMLERLKESEATR